MKKKQGKQGQNAPRAGQNKQTDQLKRPSKAARAASSRAPVKRRRPRKRRAYKQDPDSQYLTPAEVASIFRVIESVRDRAIFRLVYHRGLRASEPGLLQFSDWNERDGLLYIRRAKNSISRDYHLLPVEAKAVRAWIKARGRTPGPLFPSRQARAGGLGIHRNRLDQLFREYCAAAAIRPEKAHMHVLKHSCGTHLSERGNSADSIQDWLGHRAASSTQVYMHFSQRRRDEAWERNKDWK